MEGIRLSILCHGLYSQTTSGYKWCNNIRNLITFQFPFRHIYSLLSFIFFAETLSIILTTEPNQYKSFICPSYTLPVSVIF